MIHLSDRQKEIVDLLGKDYTPQEIALELRINRNTVYEQISRIAERLPDRGSGPPQQRVMKWIWTTRREAATQRG